MRTRTVAVSLAIQAMFSLVACGSPLSRSTVTDGNKFVNSEAELKSNTENEIGSNFGEINSTYNDQYERFLGPAPNEFTAFCENFTSEIAMIAEDAALSAEEIEKVKDIFQKNEVKANGEDRTKWTNDDWDKFEREHEERQEAIRKICYDEIAHHENLNDFFNRLDRKREQMVALIDKASNDHLKKIATLVGLNLDELERFIAVLRRYRDHEIHWGPNGIDAMNTKNQLQVMKNWSAAKSKFLQHLSEDEAKPFEIFFTAVEQDYERRKRFRLHRHQEDELQKSVQTQTSQPITDLKTNLSTQIRMIAEHAGLQSDDVKTLMGIYEEKWSSLQNTDQGRWTEEMWFQHQQKNNTQMIKRTAMSKIQDHFHLEAFFDLLEKHVDRLKEVANNTTYSYLLEKGEENGLSEGDINDFFEIFEKFGLGNLPWNLRMSDLEILKSYEQFQNNFVAAKDEFQKANNEERNIKFANFFNSVEVDITNRLLQIVVNIAVGWDVSRFGRLHQLNASEIREFTDKFEKYSGIGIVWKRNATKEERQRTQEQFDKNWQLAKNEFLNGKSDEEEKKLGEFFKSIEAQYEEYKLHGCRTPLMILFGWEGHHGPSGVPRSPSRGNSHHKPDGRRRCYDGPEANYFHPSFGRYIEESFLRPFGHRNQFRDFYGNFSSEVRKLCASVGLRGGDCEKLVGIFEASRTRSGPMNRTNWTRENWDRYKKQSYSRIKDIAFERIRDSENLKLFFNRFDERKKEIISDMRQSRADYIRSFGAANGLTNDEVNSFLEIFERLRRDRIYWGPGMTEARRVRNRLTLQENWSAAKTEFLLGKEKKDQDRFEQFFKAIDNDYERRKSQNLIRWYVQGFAMQEGLTLEEVTDFLDRFNGLQQQVLAWKINMSSEERTEAHKVLRKNWKEAKENFLVEKTHEDKEKLSRFFTGIEHEYARYLEHGATGPLARLFGCAREPSRHVTPFRHPHPGGLRGRPLFDRHERPLPSYSASDPRREPDQSLKHARHRRYEGLLPASHPQEFRNFNRNFRAEARRIAHESNLSESDTNKLIDIIEENLGGIKLADADRSEWTEVQWEEEHKRLERHKAQVQKIAMELIEDHEHLHAFFKAFHDRKQKMKDNIHAAITAHLKRIASESGLTDNEIERFLNISQTHKTPELFWWSGTTQIERARNERLIANNWETLKKVALEDVDEQEKVKLEKFFSSVENDYVNRARKNHQRLPSWASHFKGADQEQSHHGRLRHRSRLHHRRGDDNSDENSEKDLSKSFSFSEF